MKQCPYCKTENHDEATVCKACRKEISKTGIAADTLKTVASGIEGCGCLITIIGIIAIIIMFFIFTK